MNLDLAETSSANQQGENQMRTTCPKCKKAALTVVEDYSQIVTTTTEVLRTSWGYFDQDGTVHGMEDEQVDTEQLEEEADDGEYRRHVECERCHFVVADHPLSAIDQDEANAIMAANGHVKVA